MKKVEIDENILKEPPTPIDMKSLDLKLDITSDLQSTNLIPQINDKINFLNSRKNFNEDALNKKKIEIINSEKKNAINLSSNIQQPIQTADAISSDIQAIKDNYSLIQENVGHLTEIRDAVQKREKLKKLKDEALRLANFFEIFEKLKSFYENRDFIQVSNLYNQIKNMNVGDRINLVNELLSPNNFKKVLNDELFKNCQNGFSILSLFQCLLFIKNPNEVVQIITYNKKFDFNFDDFSSMYNYYMHRFDVIYAIYQLSKKGNIVDANERPWKMPSFILDVLTDPKKNIIKQIGSKFCSFIKNVNIQQNSLISTIFDKWSEIKSLILLSNLSDQVPKSYSMIAYRQVKYILENGTKSNSSNDGKYPKTGVLYQCLNECFTLFKQESNESNLQESDSTLFLKNLIEAIILLLIRSIINNSFNIKQPFLINGCNYFNDKTKQLLNEDSLLKDLNMKSDYRIDVELILSDLNIMIKEFDVNNELVVSFQSDGFWNAICSFIPNFIYYTIPIYLGGNTVKECCQDKNKFRGLNLRVVFLNWSNKYRVSEATLRQTALEYFIANKPYSLLGRITEPKDLFREFYPES